MLMIHTYICSCRNASIKVSELYILDIRQEDEGIYYCRCLENIVEENFEQSSYVNKQDFLMVIKRQFTKLRQNCLLMEIQRPI